MLPQGTAFKEVVGSYTELQMIQNMTTLHQVSLVTDAVPS